jgi:hypothetical protein
VAGARPLLVMEVPTLRVVFTVVILGLAAQMIYRGAFAGG